MPTKVIPIPIEVWKKAKNIDEIDKWVKNNYPELIVKHKPKRKRGILLTDYISFGDRQVKIRLKVSKDEVLAVLPKTSLADSGESVEEAKENLKRTIEIDWEHLSRDRNNLSEALLAELRYLEEILGKGIIEQTKEEL